MARKPYLVNADAVAATRRSHGSGDIAEQQVSLAMRARKLHYGIAELPPAAGSFPSPWPHDDEAMCVVLTGTGGLIHGNETGPVSTGDVISCLPGPVNGYQFNNGGTAPLRLLFVSTGHVAAPTAEPDSTQRTMAKPFTVNLDDLPWDDTFEHGRFGSDDKIVCDALRAERLDYVITRLAPGKVSCPYHAHHAGEELFIIIEGTGTLRYDGETRPLRAGDFISCPPGKASAHQLINDGNVPLVYWAISTVEPLEICEYPDSGKVLVHAAGRDGHERYMGVFRTADKVDYWLDEA